MIKISNKKVNKIKKSNIEFINEKEDYAIIIETKYNSAIVLYENELLEVTLSKNIKGIINKILFPGDKVILEDSKITGIIKRKNILSREKYDSTKLNDIGVKKIIATNIDIAIIVVAANEPPLHPKFIDRYMILLNNSNIPFIICINKCDLLSKKEEKTIKLYESLGIKIIKTSIYNKSGIEELKNVLNSKQAIFVGHSGVGKSSLINTILNESDIKTGSLGNKTKKGCHTTTSSTYYKWNENSGVIDTPGIRSLDLSNYKVEDIKNSFEEFIPYNNLCKYKNCHHNTEPVSFCMIKKQVINGTISKERYESYLKIINEIKRK